MKNVLLKMLCMMLCASAVIFSSCSKDDDDEEEPTKEEGNEKGNYVKIDGQTYDLGISTCWYWTESDTDLTGSDIYFYAPGTTINSTGYVSLCPGIVVNLYDLYSESDGIHPLSGTYSYSDSEINLSHDGFSGCSSDGYDYPELANDLVITVNKISDTEYEFSWTGTDENGKSVEGHYKGTVAFYED